MTMQVGDSVLFTGRCAKWLEGSEARIERVDLNVPADVRYLVSALHNGQRVYFNSGCENTVPIYSHPWWALVRTYTAPVPSKSIIQVTRSKTKPNLFDFDSPDLGEWSTDSVEQVEVYIPEKT